MLFFRSHCISVAYQIESLTVQIALLLGHSCIPALSPSSLLALWWCSLSASLVLLGCSFSQMGIPLLLGGFCLCWLLLPENFSVNIFLSVSTHRLINVMLSVTLWVNILSPFYRCKNQETQRS